MWQNKLDSSLIAIACYCILAFGVTGIYAQDVSNEAKDSPALPENEATSSITEKVLSSTSSKANANLKTNVGPSKTFFDAPEWFPAAAESGVLSKDGVETLPVSEPGYGKKLRVESRGLILEKVGDYVDLKLGDGASQYVNFSLDELKKMGVVSHEAFVTGIDQVTGKKAPAEMYYATLQFDSNFRKKAEQTWIEKRQSSRLLQIGLVSAGLLLVIGFLFGTLKLNSATSGFYQGRLQFLGGIVILAIIGAATYFGLQLDWI